MIDDYQPAAQLIKVLAHPVRLAILNLLRDGEVCVCHLEAALRQRQAYISQQLALLREAGLVADRRDGWRVYYHVIRPEVYDLLAMIDQLTGGNFSVIAAPDDCPCPVCQPVAERVAG